MRAKFNELEKKYLKLCEKAEEDLHKAQWNYKIGLGQSQSANKKLKDRIAELEKRCHFIWALGYDYDGCEKAESLKSLIDELVAISQGNWGDVCSKYENKQDNLINDKLKQFAERLKERLYNFQTWEVPYDEWCKGNVVCGEIDETLKEFIDG